MTLLCALMLLASGPASPGQLQGSPLSGVYSNVSYSDETGDAGGFEVRLDANTSQPTIVFTICEGGCYGGETWPVTIDGNRIAFRVTRDLKSSDGSVWTETEDYEGTFAGDVLTLRSSQVPGANPYLLRVALPTPGQTERLAGRTD